MSVYILGMEMPKNCLDCPCYHHKVDDGYYDYEICRASGTVFNDGYSSVTGHKDHIDPFKARLENCPLVPVPSHGRLVDARYIRDAIIQKWMDKAGDSHMYKCGMEDAYEVIRNAPTIIPAEPCKEKGE